MSPSELTESVQIAVNSLYNPNPNTTARRMARDIKFRSVNIADSFSDITFDMTRNMRINSLDRQWSITVVVDRFPLDTSFLIDFFMGDAPDDVSTWATAKNLIGTYAQFGPANVTMLHPTGFPAGQVCGEISMTHTVAAGVARGIIRDLSPKSVVPLLRKALNWKARTPAGVQVPITSLTGLSISISSRSLIASNTRGGFPEYGPVQWQGSATEGKPCGAPHPPVRL